METGEKFVDSFNEKLVREGITKVRFWEVARFVDAGKIPVRFYVALLDAACRPELLELIKKDLKGVGVIRINKYNRCRDYVRRSKIKDFGLCESTRVEIPISMPVRDYVRQVLEFRSSNQNVRILAAKLDSKIRKMRPRHTRAFRRRRILHRVSSYQELCCALPKGRAYPNCYKAEQWLEALQHQEGVAD